MKLPEGRPGAQPSLHLAPRIAEFFDVPVEVVFSLRQFPRLGDRTA